MENTLNSGFSKRLRDTLIAAGFQSHRSPYGVNVHKLSEITGHSSQICRKYLRGETIPELNNLTLLASKLKVSPSWLLFGEHANPSSTPITISINKNALHYLLNNIRNLYQSPYATEHISDFLLDLIHDVSQIETSEAQLKKIIDLALASTKHFR